MEVGRGGQAPAGAVAATPTGPAERGYPAAMRCLLPLLLPLAACSAPDAPPECGDEETACFRGAFRTLVDEPVEGMELCAPELDLDCVRSEADGSWQLPGLPLDADVFLTAEHADFVATLFPQHTSMDWYAWHKVAVPPFVLNSHADRLGEDLDPELGQLLFLVWEGLNVDGVDTPHVQGVTGELHRPDGGVFYADAIGLASASATSTTSSGSGGALNLDVGTASLSLTAPAGPCEGHSFSYAFEPGEPIEVPLRAGFATAIDVLCPAP